MGDLHEDDEASHVYWYMKRRSRHDMLTVSSPRLQSRGRSRAAAALFDPLDQSLLHYRLYERDSVLCYVLFLTVIQC
jgi:hypothetical protein